MRFTARITVVGIKKSKGTLDNGTAFDSTKVFVLTDMDGRKGDARGQSTADYQIGDSTEFDKFAQVPMPFLADADMEILTTGKTSRTVVHQLRPVADQKVPPQRAAA